MRTLEHFAGNCISLGEPIADQISCRPLNASRELLGARINRALHNRKLQLDVHLDLRHARELGEGHAVDIGVDRLLETRPELHG